eukprot:2066030-Amphidinium_carterae.1
MIKQIQDFRISLPFTGAANIGPHDTWRQRSESVLREIRQSKRWLVCKHGMVYMQGTEHPPVQAHALEAGCASLSLGVRTAWGCKW